MVLLAAAGCEGTDMVRGPVPLTRVQVDRTYLRDANGRYVMYHGVNVSGSTKVPHTGSRTIDTPLLGTELPRDRSRAPSRIPSTRVRVTSQSLITSSPSSS